VDARTQRLRRTEDTEVFLEDGNRPIEAGTMAVRISDLMI
jgi:hypothetical protein